MNEDLRQTTVGQDTPLIPAGVSGLTKDKSGLRTKFLVWFFGISILAWALLDSQFRNAEGFLTGRFILPLAVAISSIVLGWAISGPLRKSAFWFMLALIGQAVALQLIDAGTMIHYQHYKPPRSLLSSTEFPLLIYLLAQTAIVSIGLWNRLADLRSWIGRNFKTWQIIGIGSVFVFSSAALSRDVPAYVIEVLFATFVQAVNLATIVLMVLALPESALTYLQRGFDKILGPLRGGGAIESGAIDRFAVLAALWVTVLTAALAVFSYEAHPHVQDEVAYLYQARYLAAGAMTLPAPPVPGAFDLYLMEFKGDQWFPSTPPGWPALLALGVRFGAPWLVNPLLAGLNLLLAYLFIREIYDRWTARLSLLLLCASPWFLFMGMNLMTHTFTLTCALAGALSVAWSRRTGRARWAFLGGAMVGMGTVIRPFDGLLAAGLLGLWVIGIGGRRLKAVSIAALVIGSVLVGAVVLPYNKLLTGSATVFPLNAYLDEHFGAGRNDLGFGANRGYGWALQPFPGHSPLGALVNTDLNIFSLNTDLFGWSTGSLLGIALLIFSGTLRKNDYLMLAVIGIIVGTFSLYWYSGGPDFGARYWYLILIPCIALTVRGIQVLMQLLESRTALKINGARVLVGVFALSFLTLVNYIPWRALDKYHDYLGMRPDILSLAREYEFGKSLVLIHGESHPDYESAAIYNPLDFHADAPIYAWGPNPQVETAIVRAYSDRPVWVVDGPSITKRGYEVIAGPLAAQQILARESNLP
jgi:hypothetical protein